MKPLELAEFPQLTDMQARELPAGSVIITVNKTIRKAYQYITTGKRNVGGHVICKGKVHFGYWFFDSNWVYLDSPELRTTLLLRDTPIIITG
jgi:hypothetical protein